MPVAHNLSSVAINLRIGEVLPGDGSLELTDDQATLLKDHPLLSIEPDAPATSSSGSSSAPAQAPAAPAAPAVDPAVAAAQAELAHAQADLDSALSNSQESK